MGAGAGDRAAVRVDTVGVPTAHGARTLVRHPHLNEVSIYAFPRTAVALKSSTRLDALLNCSKIVFRMAVRLCAQVCHRGGHPPHGPRAVALPLQERAAGDCGVRPVL